jgi:predicted neutral ceramidase superfamily lipid hydrolase
MQFRQKPYNLFLLAAALIVILGLLTYKSTIDINVSDTYYILPLTILTWIPTMMLLLFWVLYSVTKAYLWSKWLTWTHVVLTIIISLVMVTSPYLSGYSYSGVPGAPRRYYDHGELNRLHVFHNLSDIVVLAALILIGGQLLYFVNLFTGIFIRRVRQNNR